eukprot:TRINITY_DN62291_c0_g1_i2.p1 TRINITY_DN62291_c0_g1~~TRINITY_DN62291_c0_g1_i2.p1  ORF type:complete len:355 (+),score=25.64 TRINITY_DN62291_c0_g1_i2:13-1077(+)
MPATATNSVIRQVLLHIIRTEDDVKIYKKRCDDRLAKLTAMEQKRAERQAKQQQPSRSPSVISSSSSNGSQPSSLHSDSRSIEDTPDTKVTSEVHKVEVKRNSGEQIEMEKRVTEKLKDLRRIKAILTSEKVQEAPLGSTLEEIYQKLMACPPWLIYKEQGGKLTAAESDKIYKLLNIAEKVARTPNYPSTTTAQQLATWELEEARDDVVFGNASAEGLLKVLWWSSFYERDNMYTETINCLRQCRVKILSRDLRPNENIDALDLEQTTLHYYDLTPFAAAGFNFARQLEQDTNEAETDWAEELVKESTTTAQQLATWELEEARDDVVFGNIQYSCHKSTPLLVPGVEELYGNQ